MKKIHRLICLISCMLIFLMMYCQLHKNTSYGQSYRPRKGQQCVFGHQESYKEAIKNGIQRPFGLTLYANIKQDVSLEHQDKTFRSLNNLLMALNNEVPMILIRLTHAQMKDIASGQYNHEIEKFANTLKDYGKPVYLSFGFEVNNPIYEMPVQEYVKSYQYFVQKMFVHEVSNVSYVWHVIAMKPRWAEPVLLEDCYPGDDFVNWLGLSIHNIQDHHYPDGTFFEKSDFETVFSFAKKHHLPVMICESSTRSLNKDSTMSADSLWTDWYKPFFKIIDQNDVQVISHIFYNFSDEKVIQMWRDELKKKQYINHQSDPIKFLH